MVQDIFIAVSEILKSHDFYVLSDRFQFFIYLDTSFFCVDLTQFPPKILAEKILWELTSRLEPRLPNCEPPCFSHGRIVCRIIKLMVVLLAQLSWVTLPDSKSFFEFLQIHDFEVFSARF